MNQNNHINMVELLDLPNEIIVMILKCLSKEDQIIFCLCNRFTFQFRKLLNHRTPFELIYPSGFRSPHAFSFNKAINNEINKHRKIILSFKSLAKFIPEVINLTFLKTLVLLSSSNETYDSITRLTELRQLLVKSKANYCIKSSSLNKLTNLKMLNAESAIEFDEPMTSKNLMVLKLKQNMRGMMLMISGLENLISFMIDNIFNTKCNPLTDDDYTEMAKLTNLKYLMLKDNGFNDGKMVLLASLDLVLLDLTTTNNCDIGSRNSGKNINTESLKSMTNLISLTISIRTDFSQCFDAINHLTSLRELRAVIRESTVFDNKTVTLNLPKLKKLFITRRNNNISIKGIENSPKLITMHLAANRVSIETSSILPLKALYIDSSSAKLNPKHLINLTCLTIENYNTIANISTVLTSLERLNVSINDSRLLPEAVQVISQMTSLTSLTVTHYNSNHNPVDYGPLKSLPKLKYIKLPKNN